MKHALCECMLCRIAREDVEADPGLRDACREAVKMIDDQTLKGRPGKGNGEKPIGIYDMTEITETKEARK